MSEFYLHPLSVDYAEFLKQKLLNMSDAADHKGCVKWNHWVDKEGYGSTKVRSHFDDRRFTLNVHRLMYFIHARHILTPDHHTSHLCHQKLCINTDHLSYEPAAVNLQRTTCNRKGYCGGHDGYKDCLLRQ